MRDLLRQAFLLVGAALGAWGAIQLIGVVVRVMGDNSEFHLSLDAVPLLIPVGLIGALLGAVLVGMLFPKRY